MSGNVSLVQVGVSDVDKEELLEVAGLNAATVRHCMNSRTGYDEPDAQGVIESPLGQEPVMVSRPAGMMEMWGMPTSKAIDTTPKKLSI